MKIGVYVCHCGTNIAATVNIEEVTEFARSLPDAAVAKNYIYLCADPGQELIRNDIKEFGLDRVVIAACSPAMHQIAFMDNVQKTGLNPYLLERANIREQCSWVHPDVIEATEKAKRLIAAAAAKAFRSEPLEAREVSVVPAALVIGGGIAGIQAALDLGKAGFQVYLVEKQPRIGGHVAQLERTFPTLEDTEQIIPPMMAELVEHPNIKLLASSEVTGVEGYIGNFKVKVQRKPGYIDPDKCTRCGACTEVCPAEAPSEFDLGLSKRPAVYLPRGMPSHYLIDPQACLYFQGGGCQACKEVCEPDAIKFDQREENIEIEVGAIIIAAGYDIFDARLKPEYGYGRYPNVITAPEFERLCSTSGPTRGRIQIGGRAPQNVVFLQCVGSRDKSVGIEYCSRVCCMYTAKQAHRVKEEIPEAKVTICYTDIRAFGKGHEQFYEPFRRRLT
jgi:heterodisulfide reductase subunit A